MYGLVRVYPRGSSYLSIEDLGPKSHVDMVFEL